MFDAFVSYSHVRDAELARGLKTGLERLGIPNEARLFRRRSDIRALRFQFTRVGEDLQSPILH